MTLDFWQGSIWPQCGVPLEKEKLVFHVGMKSAVIHPCARRWAGNREQYMLLLRVPNLLGNRLFNCTFRQIAGLSHAELSNCGKVVLLIVGPLICSEDKSKV